MSNRLIIKRLIQSLYIHRVTFIFKNAFSRLINSLMVILYCSGFKPHFRDFFGDQLQIVVKQSWNIMYSFWFYYENQILNQKKHHYGYKHRGFVNFYSNILIKCK